MLPFLTYNRVWLHEYMFIFFHFAFVCTLKKGKKIKYTIRRPIGQHIPYLLFSFIVFLSNAIKDIWVVFCTHFAKGFHKIIEFSNILLLLCLMFYLKKKKKRIVQIFRPTSLLLLSVLIGWCLLKVLVRSLARE